VVTTVLSAVPGIVLDRDEGPEFRARRSRLRATCVCAILVPRNKPVGNILARNAERALRPVPRGHPPPDPFFSWRQSSCWRSGNRCRMKLSLGHGDYYSRLKA